MWSIDGAVVVVVVVELCNNLLSLAALGLVSGMWLNFKGIGKVFVSKYC